MIAQKETSPTVFLAVIAVVAALYFAQTVLIPVAVAVLLSFLLAPLVLFLRKRGLPRVPSVIAIVLLALTTVALVFSVMTYQLVDLTDELPKYRKNIRAKIQAFNVPKASFISRTQEVFREMFSEANAQVKTGQTPNAATEDKPVRVEVKSNTGLNLLKGFFARIVNPLATAGIVFVFTIFMLIQFEDLRDRLIRLIGSQRLNVTTQALNEAGQRVSRYLLMQLLLNVIYGIPVVVGLYFIGIPNPLLWGMLTVLLRFIPYLGPALGAILPIALAFAVDPGWMKVILCVGLFVTLELVSNNFLEPWLYGTCTGISSVGILFAAVFWTWLWGPIGLFLATPLMVCIVVIGRYVPHLEFLSVIFGDEPVLSADARYYQRLLTRNSTDAIQTAQEFIRENSVEAAYQHVIIPALRMAERDRHRGALTDEQQQFILQTTRELIEDLMDADMDAAIPVEHEQCALPGKSVFCIPAADEADELVALLLSHVLRRQGIATQAFSIETSNTIAMNPEVSGVICISGLPPFASRHARYLCRRLRRANPTAKIVVGLWDEQLEVKEMGRIAALSDKVVNSLEQATAAVRALLEDPPSTNQSRCDGIALPRAAVPDGNHKKIPTPSPA